MSTVADALVPGDYYYCGNHHQSLGIIPKAKTRIGLALLTTPDLIHCGLHVAADAASWDTTQCACRH